MALDVPFMSFLDQKCFSFEHSQVLICIVREYKCSPSRELFSQKSLTHSQDCAIVRVLRLACRQAGKRAFKGKLCWDDVEYCCGGGCNQ
jgi:hypothetical protein